MSTIHQGDLLREVTKNSGYPITALTKKLRISRTTLYKKFSLEKLDTSFFIEVGRIIGYDFSFVNEEIARYMKCFLPVQIKTLRANINHLLSQLKTLKDSLRLEQGKPSRDTETQLLPTSLFY